MKPSLGRIVLVPASALPGYANNGGAHAPAVITRVWADDLVNVRVLLDGNDTAWLTSVRLHESEAALRDAGQPVGCFWPPRV